MVVRGLWSRGIAPAVSTGSTEPPTDRNHAAASLRDLLRGRVGLVLGIMRAAAEGGDPLHEFTFGGGGWVLETERSEFF